MEKLIIRPMKDDEYPIIVSIIYNVFGHHTPDEWRTLLKWRYENNPAREGCPHHYFVGEVNKEIIGVIGLIPYRIKISNDIVSIVSPIDLAVKQEARSKGYGRKIRTRILDKGISPFLMSTSCNIHTNKLSLSSGGKEIIEGKKKFIKPLRTKNFIERKLSKSKYTKFLLNNFALYIMSIPFDIIFKIKNHFSTYSKISDASIENIVFFDSRFDAFWEQISEDYPVLIVRDSAYLNWRYCEYPFNRFHSFCLTRNNKILGFAVFYMGIDENELKFTSILELLTPKNSYNIFEHILHEIIIRSIQGDCDCIITITSDKSIQKILQKYGFRIKEIDFSPYTYHNNGSYPEELLSKSENWHISLGDGDANFY